MLDLPVLVPHARVLIPVQRHLARVLILVQALRVHVPVHEAHRVHLPMILVCVF